MRPAPLPLADASLDRAWTWLSRRHWRATLALALLSLCCFLPGRTTIGPIDRDEPRFAQATRQMIETGNYVDIRLGDEPRYAKPIGIYWLQAGLVRITGDGPDAGIGAYRRASLLGALGAVLLTWWAGVPLFGRRAALLAAGLLAVSMLLTGEAHLAKTDAVLLATVVLAMGALGRVYLAGADRPAPTGTALLFWIGLGLAILVKGPIAPLVAGLAILTLVAVERRAGWLQRLRPAIGLPLLLAIVVPWFAAILSIGGREFLQQSLWTDLLGKVASGQQGHAAPPGTHAVLFWVMFWPGAALAPFAAGWVWRRRRDPPVLFCLAWLAPTWLVFEAVVTKLPHYTLPTYPAIAMLIGATGAAGGFSHWPRWARLAAAPPALLAVGLALAAVVALALIQDTIGVAPIGMAALVTGLGAVAITAGWRRAPRLASVATAAAAVAAYIAVMGVAAPRLERLQVSGLLADAVARVAPCDAPEVAAAGYVEPSVRFALGTGTRFTDGPGAAEHLADRPCPVALVEATVEGGFLARAAELDLDVARPETVEGINTGNVGPVRIGAWVVHASGTP